MRLRGVLRRRYDKRGSMPGCPRPRSRGEVGVDQPMVSAYEHARRAPSWTTFERLVRGAGAVAELRVEPLPDNAFTVAGLGGHVAASTDTRRRRRLVLEFFGRFAATPA